MCCLSMDSYPCSTDVIATFHSLSVSGTAIGGYPSIVLMMLCHIFFFNKKMAYSSSVSAFMASASNSIIKSVVFLLFLLEGFYFPFSICCLCLITECGLDLLDKLFLILGSGFFVQFIELSLCINTCYTSSKVSQNCRDPVVSL